MVSIHYYTCIAVLLLSCDFFHPEAAFFVSSTKLCSDLDTDSYKDTTVDGDSMFLNDVYTDAFSVSKKTADVYANNMMQACIFVAVTYEGGNATEDEVRDFVTENVKIYELTQSGEKVPLDWAFSSSSNGFLHDFSSGVSKAPTSDDIEIRVPFYFTVPTEASGTHRWVAGYNGDYTSVQDPVEITCHSLSVTRDDFEFIHFGNCIVALKYKDSSVPENVRIQRCAKCDELDPAATMTKVNSPSEYGKYTKVYEFNDHVSPVSIVLVVGLEDLMQREVENIVHVASDTEDSITSAFAQGIAMCDDLPKYDQAVENLKLCKKYRTPFKLEDTCGNYVNAYLTYNERGEWVVYRLEITH